MSMRKISLGLLAYCSQNGLGYQTQAFYRHLKPDKTMVVNISMHNGLEQYRGMYQDGAYFIDDFPNKKQMQTFLSGLDVVLFAETPLTYEFYSLARQMGVKTANQINPEFFDHYDHEYPLPDMFILPSTWMQKEISMFAKAKRVQVKHLHLPVDREQFKYRPRTTKKLFHIAGKPAHHDRNGTWDFMQAVPNGVVVTQDEAFARQIRNRYRHCNVFTGIASPEQLYQFGDIMILPRRYGGNCLPLNEALSSGCPVIMPNISPNSDLLPDEWLVPATQTGKFYAHTNVDIYSVDPAGLRAKIEEIKTWDIREESEKANQIAERISWEAMRQDYMDTLQGLVS